MKKERFKASPEQFDIAKETVLKEIQDIGIKDKMILLVRKHDAPEDQADSHGYVWGDRMYIINAIRGLMEGAGITVEDLKHPNPFQGLMDVIRQHIKERGLEDHVSFEAIEVPGQMPSEQRRQEIRDQVEQKLKDSQQQ